MKREIKFRAFLDGEMKFFGKSVFVTNDDELVFREHENHYIDSWPQHDDLELMQYTGLKDKNGVEIYESDIVELEVEFCGASNEYYEQEGFHVIHTGVVTFMPSKGFHLKISRSWDLDNNEPWIAPKTKGIVQYRSKVIGNIHENPELIK